MNITHAFVVAGLLLASTFQPDPAVSPWSYGVMTPLATRDLCATDYVQFPDARKFQVLATASTDTVYAYWDEGLGQSGTRGQYSFTLPGTIESIDLRVVANAGGGLWYGSPVAHVAAACQTVAGSIVVVRSFALIGGAAVPGSSDWTYSTSDQVKSISLAENHKGGMQLAFVTNSSSVWIETLQSMPSDPYCFGVSGPMVVWTAAGEKIEQIDITANISSIWSCAILLRGTTRERVVVPQGFFGGLPFWTYTGQSLLLAVGDIRTLAIASNAAYDPDQGAAWPAGASMRPFSFAVVTDVRYPNAKTRLFVGGPSYWDTGWLVELTADYGLANLDNSLPDIDGGADFYEVTWLCHDRFSTLHADSAGTTNVLSRGLNWQGVLIDEFDPAIQNPAFKRVHADGNLVEGRPRVAIAVEPFIKKRTMTFAYPRYGTASQSWPFHVLENTLLGAGYYPFP